MKNLSKNQYYSELGERLEAKYPNTVFTTLYHTEIATDQQMVSQNAYSNSIWKWVLGILLALSVFLNLFLVKRQRAHKRKQKDDSVNKLTSQEQKIVNEILKDKTNKEIATALFISLSTVKTHINNLYKKLNVSSREEIKQLFS